MHEFILEDVLLQISSTPALTTGECKGMQVPKTTSLNRLKTNLDTPLMPPRKLGLESSYGKQWLMNRQCQKPKPDKDVMVEVQIPSGLCRGYFRKDRNPASGRPEKVSICVAGSSIIDMVTNGPIWTNYQIVVNGLISNEVFLKFAVYTSRKNLYANGSSRTISLVDLRGRSTSLRFINNVLTNGDATM
ncbi:hypothetical protein RF11_12074 [Thelohanellus kitauei]|uniref:Uncharacterized protein n=1 Tax=Thelohanellus kitauei TaxID=669202 RepID=A0A0C2N4G8_THEKT|nr:hypothetical protein RF11_12074 [Thelohanellus kitauei]